jgi:ATP adenylyltransferase
MSNTGCELCKLLENEVDSETFICHMPSGSLFIHRDQSYRGRCIFVLNTHIEELTELPLEQFINFSREMRTIAKSIKTVFNPARINYAILGNAIGHLHWHIIPRYKDDSNLGKPPWPHERRFLKTEEYKDLSTVIARSLGFGDNGSKNQVT